MSNIPSIYDIILNARSNAGAPANLSISDCKTNKHILVHISPDQLPTAVSLLSLLSTTLLSAFYTELSTKHKTTLKHEIGRAHV